MCIQHRLEKTGYRIAVEVGEGRDRRAGAVCAALLASKIWDTTAVVPPGTERSGSVSAHSLISTG